MDDTEARVVVLAQDLYTGWVVNQHRDGIAPPRWFALHHNLKEQWYAAATAILAAYDDHPRVRLRP